MADTPRPADPLTEEARAVRDWLEQPEPMAHDEWLAEFDRRLATLDAARPPEEDLTLVRQDVTCWNCGNVSHVPIRMAGRARPTPEEAR